MSYKGISKFPLTLTAAAQLERNRLLTVTDAGVPAYGTYGSTPVGVSAARGDANDYATAVTPLAEIGGSFFLTLGGTLAAGGVVLCGASGVGVPSLGTVQSRSLGEDASPTQGELWIVPTNIDWEAGSNQEKVATRGAGSWTYAAAAAGDAYWVADECIYVVFNGTAWVEAPVACVALDSGASGNDIACYRPRPMGMVSVEQLDSGVRPNARIAVSGQSVSETDADASVVITDERILSTDFAICTIGAQAGTAYIVKAVCTANTLTVTLSANGGAGTIINYLVCRRAV